MTYSGSSGVGLCTLAARPLRARAAIGEPQDPAGIARAVLARPGQRLPGGAIPCGHLAAANLEQYSVQARGDPLG